MILFNMFEGMYDENHDSFWDYVAFTLLSIIQQSSQPHWSKDLMVVKLHTLSEIIYKYFTYSLYLYKNYVLKSCVRVL